MIRGKSLPLTDEFNDCICYFRHALALDERRVKFLPEYVCGGESYTAMSEGVATLSPNELLQDDSSSANGVSRINETLSPFVNAL